MWRASIGISVAKNTSNWLSRRGSPKSTRQSPPQRSIETRKSKQFASVTREFNHSNTRAPHSSAGCFVPTACPFFVQWSMNAFAQYYKTHIFKESIQERLVQLDFLINEIIGRMSLSSSPTMWNDLLQQKEDLEIQRGGLVDSINGMHYE